MARTETYTYVCADREPSTPGTIQGIPGEVTLISPEDDAYEENCAECIGEEEPLNCYLVYDPDGGGTYQEAIYDTNDLATIPDQQNATLTNDVSLQTGNAAYNPTSTTLPNN